MTAAAHAAPGAVGAERTRARPYTVDIDIGGTLTDGLFSDGDDRHAGQGRHHPARLHGLLLRVPEGGRASSSASTT